MTVEIKFENRNKTKKARALRAEGVIPATLYGPEIEATEIQLNAKEFSRVNFHDYTHLINLKADDAEHEVLIKNIQRDFVTREVLNIEFYKIKRGHKVTMKVELKFEGSSEAVKLGADLVTIHKEANIRCLPRNIPYFLSVDISKLKNVGDQLSFANIEVDAEKIEILDPEKEVVCKAESKRINTVETSAPTAEATTEATAEATAEEAPEEAATAA